MHKMALQRSVQEAYPQLAEDQRILTISSVQVDSRYVEVGSLFFALSGDKTNGHLFLSEVIAKGAVAVVISDTYTGEIPDHILVIRAHNVLFALQEIARIQMKRLNPNIIGITGSVGKTTTKEFVKSLLSTEKKIFSPPGNMNSQIGMALSILSHSQGDEEWYVLEMGMTHSGNIARLIEIAPPNIAVITSIHYVHAVNFSDLEAIAAAKTEIFSSSKTSLRLIHAESNCIDRLISVVETPYKTYSTSLASRSDWFLERRDGQLFIFERGVYSHQIPDPEFLSTPLYDNLLAAVVIAREVGISWASIAMGVLQIQFPPHRMDLSEKRGIFFLDDSYNASEISMQAALVALESLREKKGGRSIAILGQMQELGIFSESIHRSIGASISERIDLLLCFGKEAIYIHEEAINRGICSFWSSSFHAIDEYLKKYVRQRDTVLLKGACSNQLWRILESYTDSVQL
ncbi:MAG: UDP-N-acetylmuramoyl-tripeptide--D-alanyl-D-alanine ligase [Chlamydia sp.]